MRLQIPRKVTLNRLTRVVIFIFLFTVFSGAIRKWVISNKLIGNGILFLQILVPFTFLFVKGGLKNWMIGRSNFLLLLSVLIIGIFNPLNLTFSHGVLGFFLHLSFFFIVFFYLNNRVQFQFEAVLSVFVYLGITQLAIGFLQFSSPADSFINTYADVEAVGGIAIVGNAARVSGTFSYISGFTGYLLFHSLLVWAMVKFGYKSIFILIMLSGGMIACFMSGARSATYLYLIILGVVFIAENRAMRKAILDFKLFLPAAFILLLFLGIGSSKFLNLIDNSFTGFMERRERGVESGEQNQRIFGDIIEVINFRGQYPYFGVGLGSTYQGATKLFGTSEYIIQYGFYESEFVRIILEGGFLLFVTRIFLTIYLVRKLFIPPLGKFILCIILIAFFSTVFNVYNAVFAALGIILVDYFYYKPLLLNHQNKRNQQQSLRS